MRRNLALLATCAAAALAIPDVALVAGLACWVVAAALVATTGDLRFRRNLGVVLACVLVLALAPIHTDLDTPHFFALGIPFLLVVVGPYLFMRWRAPGELPFRFWPRKLSWMEIGYTASSIPLAWIIIRIYFFHLNPELPTHWPMPEESDPDAARRLTIGINLVGIWDELFFINTVFVLLRGVFPFRVANLGQAVLYTAVLYDMAFTGWGIVIVYGFALIQGIMYERSGVLLYVLIVHLIVDVFLVLAILQYHYPDRSLPVFL